ncbi:MAG TPA: tetratricopeptide repeat protein [Thermoanaerobaculia bacterium]|jgi:tetratricopeptide (TPR) repeat protein|nr:tetratricopeptide repeat protein [Thermoanaerobaculia bacterium]
MTKRRPDPKAPFRDDLPGYEVGLKVASGNARSRLTEILQEVDAAASLIGELLAKTGPERSVLVRAEEVRLHGLALCGLLQEKIRGTWFSDPAQAVELAELAVEVSDRLDTDHYGVALVEDARALAWAYLGNSSRIASDLRRAEEALRSAEEHLRLGDEDELTRAQILSFQASLHNAQGRFEEAARLLDQAIAVYRDAKARHLEGRALIKKATAFGYAGKFKQAERLVRQGLSRINFLEEPQVLVAARHNLVWYLTEGGHHEEAQRALEETRGLYLGLAERINLVRLRWLEGRIAFGLGRLNEAETALREARDAFIERGIGFDAALISLHLAAVYAKKGDNVEMKRLAAEMVPIFESRDLHPEALTALTIFRQAAEAEEVTLGLVERMAVYLQRARRNPEMRFDSK